MGISAWGIIMCIALPLSLFRITGDKTVWRHFPDGPGAAACVLSGWFTAAILTVIIKSVFEFIYSRRAEAAAATTPSDT